MTLAIQAIEQKLITLLEYHQHLVSENKQGDEIHRIERRIRRYQRLYERTPSHA